MSVLIGAAVAAIVVAACGSAGSTAVLSTVGSSVDGYGSQPEAMPAASAAASAAPAAEDPLGLLPGRAGGQVDNGAPRDDLKIVYTGSLQLVVDDLATALAKAKTAVLATGGYIGASQESNDGDRSIATITYRIPATRWEDAISDLRALAAKVVAEETQATEVGGQIVDLEARIRNLRASETSLQEIAKGTGKVSDLLEVEAQLSQVRGEIEQLDGQRAQLQDQVAYGTLVTTFGLEAVQLQVQAQGWDPRTDVDGAFATLMRAGQTIVSGVIWFAIVWLPVLVVLLVFALIARWLFRRFAPKAGPGSGAIPGWGEGPGGS
ncbi:MAG TPA: DUF4349 domain-containing protein [Candidatus Limnocylindrales bacterium]